MFLVAVSGIFVLSSRVIIDNIMLLNSISVLNYRNLADVALAFSGGADSVCLLHILNSLKNVFGYSINSNIMAITHRDISPNEKIYMYDKSTKKI